MIIEKNIINNDKGIHNFQHDGKQLYGKPKGTYFFRYNDHGELTLVFSAGGTKIGLLRLEQDEKKRIAIISPGFQQSFASETEFLKIGNTEGFRCPAFSNKTIKLTFAISELNQVVKPLRYLSALFIAATPSLNKTIWESDDLVLPEELEDLVYELEEQLKASKVANRL